MCVAFHVRAFMHLPAHVLVHMQMPVGVPCMHKQVELKYMRDGAIAELHFCLFNYLDVISC